MITDYLYDDTAPIKDGDFVVGESEQHHIEDIIVSNKGEYRQHPLLGVGGLNFLNSSLSIDDIRKQISVQLNYDNFKVEEIAKLATGEIRVIARQNEKA